MFQQYPNQHGGLQTIHQKIDYYHCDKMRDDNKRGEMKIKSKLRMEIKIIMRKKSPLIGESLGLETKSTETLGLIPVLYKTLDVVLSQVKNFQTVLFRLLQFYSVSSWSCPDMDFSFSNIIKLKFNHFLH